MQITRTSMLTGVTRTLDLDVTEAQLADYQRGTLLQNAFPHLSPADREFIKSGATDEEWQAAFPPEDDEED